MKLKKGDFVELDYTGRIKEMNKVFDSTEEKTAKEAATRRVFSQEKDPEPRITRTICARRTIKRKVIEAGIPKDIWNVNPSPTDIMGEGDILVFIGTNKDLGRLTG